MVNQFRKPTILWDNAYAETSSDGLCIKASDDDFQMVATHLLSSVGAADPEENLNDTRDVTRPIHDFDEPLRNACLSIAMQMFALLDRCSQGEDDMPIYHRQKPDNPCVLQELQEGVWVDIFDYNLCLSPSLERMTFEDQLIREAENAPINAERIMDDFTSKYTGTSASYNPNLVLTGEHEDVNRAALCRTIKGIIQRLADSSAKAKNEQVENSNRLSLIIAVGIGIVAVATAATFLPSGGTSAALGSAAIAALGGAAKVGMG